MTADAAVLRGEVPAPRLARGVAPLHEELLCHIEDRFPAISPVDDCYEDGAWKWGFRVVHVPGHTEGSLMLYHQPTTTLFSGDAILAGPPPFRFIRYLRLAVPGFSLEVDGCRRKVREFIAALPPVSTLCSGHGPPLRDGVAALLQELSAR